MQVFTGHADWSVIASVKDAVKIPVIGNGDVVDKKSADEMFRIANCDAIMIGRAALGDPWLFSEIAGKKFPTGIEEKFRLIYRHIEILIEREEKKYVVHMMRKFVPRYLKGVHGNRELAKIINSTLNLDIALDGIKTFEKSCKDGDRHAYHVGQTTVK
jgi:tRNA-dihydrouridine synthase